MKKIPVYEFMNRAPITVHAEMPLTEFVAMLGKHQVRALSVTDADGRLTGVVSETDLFIKPKGVPFSMEKVPSLLGQVVDKDDIDHVQATQSVTVGEVMSTSLCTVNRETTLEDLAMLMYDKHLTLVPVVEGGKLIGTVRRIDVLRQLYG